MGQRVIADNWSLQTLVSMFEDGLDQDETLGIGPLTDPADASVALPQAVIDLEALFEFLADLTLRDQVLVDERFAHTWAHETGPLKELSERSLIRAHPFKDAEEQLDAPRRDFVRQLLINEQMASLQRENEASFASTGASCHPFAAQLVWGGAGMLARAWVNEAAYTPHPLRRRLFERASVTIPGPADAAARYRAAVDEHRTAIYRPPTGPNGVFGTDVLLPPIPAVVLREATSLDDLFPVALQVRAQLSGLRGWLGEYQNALASGQFDEVARQAARLFALAKEVDRVLGVKGKETGTLSVGTSWCKLNIKLDPVRWLARLDRVQVQASSLVFAPGGASELRKLLGFFGHRHSALGQRVYEYFCKPRQPDKV